MNPVRPQNICAPLNVEQGAEQMEPENVEVSESQEIAEEIEEGIRVKTHTRVALPSKEEMRQHRVTHIPYRSWCPICVAAKKKNPPHYKRGALTTEKYQ